MEQNFSVFSRRSGGDRKAELIAFYEEWGWVNFLSAMAETKIFDIPGRGLDSIECAKIAKAFNVLIYASQRKDYAIAEYEAYKIK